MNQQDTDYSIVIKVSTDYAETIEKVRTSLAEQGFGVLTEIDVSATLKKKIDVDYPRTLILGACNPPLAYRALSAVADIAVLLPCNVVVRERAKGQVEVAAMKPLVFEKLIDNKEILAVAKEVDRRINLALSALS
ncbi:MAG: DUF302 domain-containing protein [Magnetococcales bacterium]|nr:DUF302 domain-containing protein [Magnetococcales bacterium]